MFPLPESVPALSDADLILVEAFLDEVASSGTKARRRPWSDGVIRCASSTLRRFGESTASADRRLGQVRREHLLAWLDARATEVGPATVANDHRYLKAFFAWMAEEGELDGERGSPMARVRRPHVPEDPNTPVADDAIFAAVMATFSRSSELGRRNAAMLSLMYRSGLRVGELPFLDLDHYDARDRSLEVPITKAGKVRNVPVHPETAQLLKRYFRSRGVAPGPLFVPSSRSTTARLKTKAIQDVVKRASERAGVEVSSHALRRGFNVNWTEAGGSIAGLMTIAGWKSERMALRYRGKQREQVAANEFARLVEEAPALRRARATERARQRRRA